MAISNQDASGTNNDTISFTNTTTTTPFAKYHTPPVAPNEVKELPAYCKDVLNT